MIISEIISLSRTRISRFVALGLLGALTAISLMMPKLAAAQGQCGTHDQQSGQHCQAVIPTPWLYRSDWNLDPAPNEYKTIDELVAAMIAHQMALDDPGDPRTCSFTLNSLSYDIGNVGYGWPGVLDTDNYHQHGAEFTHVWTNVSPCDTTEVGGVTLHQTRTFTCPAGYTFEAQEGTAYCALDWWKPDPQKSAGGCKNGRVFVGHPCEIGSGNKYLRQDDYQASGLGIERHYNSNNAAAPIPFTFVAYGAGWSGNYFQRIERTKSGVMESAAVYRPDGQRLIFSAAGLSFIGAPDVPDQLTAQRDVSNVITGWTFKTASDAIETYDATGRLLSIRDRTGKTQWLQYSPSGTSLTVTDDFGHQLVFTLGQRHVSQVQDSAGATIGYHYDGEGRLTQVTYQDGSTRQYHYEGYLLTGVTDELDARYATYTYDGNRLTTTELAGGISKYTITADTFSRYVTDPLGKQRSYNYGWSALHHLYRVYGSSEVSGDSPTSKAVSYDDNANLSSKTDFNDVQTTYAYDLSRNLETSRTEAFDTPRARTITTQWHSSLRLPTQIDEPGKRTTFTYDGNGNVLTRTLLDTTSSESRTWTYTYNSSSEVLSADGPRTDVSDITTYTYYTCTSGYQCGQVHTITNAAGQLTTYNTYNAHGQPLTITDSNGTVTTLTYDLRQRLTSRTVSTELTAFEYWPTGLLKKVTLPDSSYLQYSYDAAHRLTAINDAEGNHMAYTLDAMGNRTKEEAFDSSLALSRTRLQVFNTLNQLAEQIGAANSPAVTTAYGYDNNGNQTSIDAPLGRDTVQTYDELNRLATVTDPETGVTQYGYNALDQLISVTDPRTQVTSYAYNALGDLTEQVSPDTGTTTNTYDSAGNLATSTDARNAVTTYTYDELNRVKTAAFKIGATTDQTLTYDYDGGTNGKGHLTGASDSDHSLSWSYDPQGRVTTKTQVQGSVTQSVTYGYTNGQLTSLTTPSGQVVSYAYSNGQVSGITINGTQLLNSVLYDPFGPARQWSWGNGTLSVRTFDQDGKITQLDSAGLNTYSYDDAFRITGITDTSNSNLSWTYDYDDLDRLTDASTPTQSLGWSYDAVGNRLNQSGSGASTYTIDSSSNQLNSITGALTRTYAYDAAGNITSDGSRTFAYNNRGRMKSTTSGITVSYTYNALGQRIKKSGTTRLFVYDEAGHLLGEYSSTGALVQETIWLGDTPVATIRPKTGGVDIFYVHADHLNTPRKITRPSDNKLRWRWDPTPFGTGTPNENPESLGVFSYNLRFPGQYYDAESGLSYNYFRDYDSQTGRYVQSDPVGLEGGLNTYLYADANPAHKIDVTGENPAAIRGAWWAGTRVGGLVSFGFEAATGISIGSFIYDMCHESDDERTERCEKNYARDMATCKKGSKRYGKDWFEVCSSQAMSRYSNCLSGRDDGIDSPLPPWGKL